MKRILLYILFFCFPLVSFAGGTDHLCSGYHSYELLDFSTHVSDPGLLKYDVRHYRISLEVNDTSAYISGYTEILATALEEIDELVLELSLDMAIDSISLNGIMNDNFTHSSNLIKILPGQVLSQDGLFRVRVYYQGTGGAKGFYSGISNRLDTQWNTWVTYTLSEPFRAMDWFVCKQVLTDKADSADIYITVNEGLMAGSNGILQGIDSLEGNQLRYHWSSGYPVAFYLLSISVSNYQDYSFYAKPFPGKDSVLVQNFIYDVPGCLDYYKEDIDWTDDILKLYSDLLIPYPFRDEKYGHCLAPMGGGMEHQTMTTLSSFRFYLVAHELAHQWFGDNVTCASWQDIWVNEGFASYGEYLAMEKLISIEQARVWMDDAQYWALTEPEGSIYIPEEDAGNQFRIFSRALSYKKGACILHMLRYELNDDEIFNNTLSEFQDRYADSMATGDDFLSVLNEISGDNYDWFFQQWYYGRGFPEFNVLWWQSNDSLNLKISQKGSSEETPFFRTHMDLRLDFENGNDTIIRIYIDQPHTKISILPDKYVTDLELDPSNYILKRTEILRKYPQNTYLSVNPNPFGDKLNIVFLAGTGEREIILTDLNGKIYEKLQSSAGSLSLDTRNLNQGLYLLQVKEGKGSYTAKVVRQ